MVPARRRFPAAFGAGTRREVPYSLLWFVYAQDAMLGLCNVLFPWQAGSEY